MDVVVVNAAPVSRAYYGEAYDPNRVAVPTCWSPDTQRPDFGGRACRFSQRLAVVFQEELEEVYQLQIPATSIFGSSKGGDKGLQEYARLLSKHDTAIIAVTTRVYFDSDSVVPKLYFKPLSRLDEDTYAAVCSMVDHEDTAKAVTMTVPVTSEPVSPFSAVEGFDINAN
jgi:hypothetical protein